jgi:HK97 family phage portal protein
MDVLARLLGGDLYAGTPGPDADFWYQSAGTMTTAGIVLDEDGAKKVSAWFRGREILATTLAMLPLDLFFRLPGDDGRDDADTHPLYDVLHRKPNPWQDSFRWRRQMMYHLIDFGNGYNRIVPGARYFAGELWPIHPSLVKPELISNGSKVFHIRDPKRGTTSIVSGDEIFHLCGMSDDGVEGKGILQYARDSLGLNVVTEQFAGRVFSRGSLSAGAIETPATLDPAASKRMAESFTTSSQNWHLPKVLEQGAKWVPGQGMTPENAQMLLSRKFGIDEMSRWLGVPPHMLASLDRSTNNNIEHQGQEFIDYTEGQWLSLWEFAINDQLVTRPDRFYAEFNRNALVRGDLATRWAAYMTAITTGTYTRNEVRVMENKKKLDGLDVPLDPQNITGKPAAGAQPTPRQQPEKSGKAAAIVTESAARVLRKEVEAVSKAAVKYAADGDAFTAWVTDFYTKHATLIAQTLQMSETQAQAYCWGQAQQIVNGAGWVASVEQWATDHYAAGLAALALEDEAA